MSKQDGVVEKLSALEELQLRNAQLEFEERTRRASQVLEQETQQKEARRQGALAQQLRRDMELATQNGCHHLKPNGQSAVAGQRDHQHKNIWICQYCSKVWYDVSLPGHLAIPMERVGGPNN